LSQHFLLSAKAVTLGYAEVARLSDEAARAKFRAVRFSANGGEPYCPRCGVDAIYEYRCREEFKCKACEKRFTLTSGTVFRSRKMSYQDILLGILIFVNGVNGNAALNLRRGLDCTYKTAFVLVLKLRRVMGSMQAENALTGMVDIDGIYIGGHIRQENMVADRATKDGRKAYSDKRKSIVTARERRPGGRSRAFVVKNEKAAEPHILSVVSPAAHVVTDDGAAFAKFYLPFADHSTVNHSDGLMINGVHTNAVEAQHSRIRRGERGVYLHISGAHAQRFADEFSWRDDYRRVSNGQQFQTVLARAAILRPDAEIVGIWRRRPTWVRAMKRRRALRVLTRRRRGSSTGSISWVGPPTG
jgi:transposase-like protein